MYTGQEPSGAIPRAEIRLTGRMVMGHRATRFGSTIMCVASVMRASRPEQWIRLYQKVSILSQTIRIHSIRRQR